MTFFEIRTSWVYNGRMLMAKWDNGRRQLTWSILGQNKRPHYGFPRMLDVFNILFQMYFMCKFLHCSIFIDISGIRVGVSIAIQAWTGCQGCRRLKLLEFLDFRYRIPNSFMWCARNVFSWPWSAIRVFLEQLRGTKGNCNVSGHIGEIRSQNFMLKTGMPVALSPYACDQTLPL